MVIQDLLGRGLFPWQDDAVWDQEESHYQKDNCSTKNEYIEKAVQFYSGYLDAERAG